MSKPYFSSNSSIRSFFSFFCSSSKEKPIGICKGDFSLFLEEGVGGPSPLYFICFITKEVEEKVPFIRRLLPAPSPSSEEDDDDDGNEFKVELAEGIKEKFGWFSVG